MHVVVASDSGEFREQLRQLSLGIGAVCSSDDCVGLGDLRLTLAKRTPNLILVDICRNTAASLALVQQVAGHVTAPILAVGDTDDPAKIVEALRSGARDYIARDNLRDSFLTTIKKLDTTGALKFRKGKTVVVTSVTPGSGVSTVATSLAFALAHAHPRQRVALVELGIGTPELALALDVEPRHSVAGLLADWEHIDARVVEEAAVGHHRGVQVLARDRAGYLPAPSDPKAVEHLALLLRTIYDVSVLDLGHEVGEAPMETLYLAEAVVVVVRLDVPSLRQSRDFLKGLVNKEVRQEKLVVVANRYGQKRQLKKKQALEALAFPIRAWIPDDPARLNQALNNGQPLIEVAARASVTRHLNQLAKQLNGLHTS